TGGSPGTGFRGGSSFFTGTIFGWSGAAAVFAASGLVTNSSALGWGFAGVLPESPSRNLQTRTTPTRHRNEAATTNPTLVSRVIIHLIPFSWVCVYCSQRWASHNSR